MMRSTAERYGAVSRVLHWAVAALIVGLVGLGWWMVDLTYYDPWYNRSLELHKALGMVALLVAVLKVGWVWWDGRPAFAPTIRPWERVAATATHRLFYLVMLAIPIAGYLVSTSDGDGIPIFGWFDIPALGAVSDAVRDGAIAVHFYLAYGVIALVAVHAGAALKHQFVDRDGTLRRMLW